MEPRIIVACRWCGQPLSTGSTPRGGRPREYHPQCRKVSKAFELLTATVEEWAANKEAPRPKGEDAAAIRREMIALGWKMAPRRVGEAD